MACLAPLLVRGVEPEYQTLCYADHGVNIASHYTKDCSLNLLIVFC
jgi:hypothetical protein